MESKIKRQSLFYGLTAILLASVLTAVILSIDLTQLGYTPGASPTSAPPSQLLSTFQSGEELKNFLIVNSKAQEPFWIYGAEDARLMNARGKLASDSALEASAVLSFNNKHPSYGSRRSRYREGGRQRLHVRSVRQRRSHSEGLSSDTSTDSFKDNL